MTEADGVYAELSAFGVLSQNLHHEEYDINVGSFFFFAPSSFFLSFLHTPFIHLGLFLYVFSHTFTLCF